MSRLSGQALRSVASVVVRRAARAYSAGESAHDALAACRRLRGRPRAFTIGYWNVAGEDPEAVLRHDLEGLDALARWGHDAYLSVKTPALGHGSAALGALGRKAAAAGIRVHLDSHGPRDADPTLALADVLRDAGAAVGVTLPGRWLRSEADAAALAPGDAVVRIVKGQWAADERGDADPRVGFLRVVRRLAGRRARVAVASHDVPLAESAVRVLREAGTPCEIELLHGLPWRASVACARRLKVNVRTYVPYGTAWLPYSLDYAKANPRVVQWVLLDLLHGLGA